MKKCKLVFMLLLALLIFQYGQVFAKGMIECGSPSMGTGKTYKVNGSGINVRLGPGTNYDKIINQKASSILKKNIYVTIDNTVTVYEECAQKGWSKIRVTDPDWLSNSHRGWVLSKFLRKKQTNVADREMFTEKDFIWDKNTSPYKEIIVAGVNKIYRENTRCKEIDPSSAYISGTKGTKDNPVFYVTCGKGRNAFNAYFSKADIEKDIRLSEKKHIDKFRAVDLCAAYAKQHATHPSTVEFSQIMDLAITEHPNGCTRVSSTFTAKNSFNFEVKYNISCLLDASGLIEANIIEAK
jgi:hypothetical protein